MKVTDGNGKSDLGLKIKALPPEPPFPAGKVPALEIKEGWFRYERNSPDILKGIHLSVPQGSFFAIVGGNGTGKTTTLKAACGICKLYRGSAKELVAALVRSDGLSKSDVDELRAMFKVEA